MSATVANVQEVRRLVASAPAPAKAAKVSEALTPSNIALSFLLLSYVWRFQDLFAILRAIQFVNLTSLLALGLFLFTGDTARVSTRTKIQTYKYALWILILMFLSVPFALFPGNAFRFIYQDHIKTFLLMILIMSSVRTLKHLAWFAAVHLFGAVVYCLYVFTHIQMVAGRLQSLIYYDSNDLGMLVVSTIPFAMYFMRPGSKVITKLLAAFALGVLLLAVVKSGSRGGFLGLVSVTLFILMKFDFFTRGSKLTAVGVVVAGMLGFGSSQYWEMMSTLLHPTKDYNWAGNAQSGRMEVWKRGLGYMRDRPIFGVGVNGFFVAEGTLSPLAKFQQYGKGLKWSAPHNSFVQIGAELGVTGLIIFLVLLRAAYRAARSGSTLARAPATADLRAFGQALAAAIIGYSATGFFLSQAYAAFLYTLLGMIIAYAALVAQQPGARLNQAPAQSVRRI